jgi:hypothetical protein
LEYEAAAEEFVEDMTNRFMENHNTSDKQLLGDERNHQILSNFAHIIIFIVAQEAARIITSHDISEFIADDEVRPKYAKHKSAYLTARCWAIRNQGLFRGIVRNVHGSPTLLIIC